MKKKSLIAALSAIAIAGMLAACSSGGGGNSAKDTGTSPKLSNCSNKAVYPKAPQVSLWGWYPNTARSMLLLSIDADA